jgi:hypothetical protein
MIMSKSQDRNTGVGVLTLEQLEAVNGGRRETEVVIVGCTDPRNGHPAPDGTVYWNPYIGQPFPMPQF